MGKKASWALPDPSPREPFPPLPSRGHSFPRRVPPGHVPPSPASCPGLPLAQPSPSYSPSALRVRWAQTFEGIGTAGPTQRGFSKASKVLGRVWLGSRCPSRYLWENPLRPGLCACGGRGHCREAPQASAEEWGPVIGREGLWGTEWECSDRARGAQRMAVTWTTKARMWRQGDLCGAPGGDVVLRPP